MAAPCAVCRPRPRPDCSCQHSDRGAGLLLFLLGAAALACACLLLAAAGAHGIREREAARVADAAALAAASAYSAPCSAAQRIAQIHRAHLSLCRIAGPDVEVEVTLPAAEITQRLARFAGRTMPPVVRGARAGPA